MSQEPNLSGNCWFFHKWWKWKRVVKRFQVFADDGKWHEVEQQWQTRSCERCGYNQDRRID